jgi:fatty-acyl-CoA synthase
MRAPYSRNLFDLLSEQAERYPERLAVICGDTYLTYPDLLQRARRLASALRAAGVRRGERVALLVNNRIEWLEIVFGAAAIGATAVPFSTWSKRREVDFLLSDSRARILFLLDQFGDQDYAADLAELVPGLHTAAPGQWRSARYEKLAAVVLIGSRALAGAESAAVAAGATPYAAFLDRRESIEALPPGEGARAQDEALVLYTSGSTAYPKAVPLSHGAMIENGFNIGERQGLRPGDRVLLAPPLFWSYGSANALCATFAHGATLVLQGRFEPAEAIDLIERYACTAIYTLPGMTSAIVTHASFRRERTASLRTGLTIGSPQDVVMAAEVLGAREICNVYGQTESYGNCSVTWHHWPLERRKQVQGPPLPGVTIRIVDPERGQALPQGEVGMIEVKGYLTPGYDGASAVQNAIAFTADGFLRTGDLGRITAAGDVQFVARDSEIIKRAGINIAPAEIEELLRQHPDVAQAGVAGAPDADKGEIIVAFVVPVRGAVVSGETLRAHCRALAANYKTPDRIEICAALPATPTGKLMRRELKRMASDVLQEKRGAA